MPLTGRLNAVTELTRNSILISELAAALDGVYDLERLMTRVVYGQSSSEGYDRPGGHYSPSAGH